MSGLHILFSFLSHAIRTRLPDLTNSKVIIVIIKSAKRIHITLFFQLKCELKRRKDTAFCLILQTFAQYFSLFGYIFRKKCSSPTINSSNARRITVTSIYC